MTTRMFEDLPRRERPVGLFASESEAVLIAQRLAEAGQRVLHYMMAPAKRIAPGPNLEAASTAADVAIECDTVLIAIDDTRILRDLLLGTETRAGIGLDLRPGADADRLRHPSAARSTIPPRSRRHARYQRRRCGTDRRRRRA